MKHYQLLIASVLALLYPNHVYAETLPSETSELIPETLDPESPYYRDPDVIYDEASSTPEVPPPLFIEDEDGPIAPAPIEEDFSIYEPGGIGHMPDEVEQDPGEYGYGPSGLGPERSKQKLDKIRQEMPGSITIKNHGNTPVRKGIESLLETLKTDFYDADATLDKQYGFVKNLDLRSRPENTFTKKEDNETPLERADEFLNTYKPLFFSAGRTLKKSTLSPINKTSLRNKRSNTVKYQQMVNGIEAHGGRLYVQLNETGITSVMVNTLTIPDNLSLSPTISEKEVLEIIKKWASKNYNDSYKEILAHRVVSPKLKILRPKIVMETNIETVLLAYKINLGFETVWMNAHTGEVITSHSNIKHISNKKLR